MSKRTNSHSRQASSILRPRRTAVAAFAAGHICLEFAVQASAEAPAKGKAPVLASIDCAWQAFGVHWFDPPAGLRGPIRQDPAYYYHSNVDGPGQVTPGIGYTK